MHGQERVYDYFGTKGEVHARRVVVLLSSVCFLSKAFSVCPPSALIILSSTAINTHGCGSPISCKTFNCTVKTFVSANVKTCKSFFFMSIRSSVQYIVQKVYANTHTLMLKDR